MEVKHGMHMTTTGIMYRLDHWNESLRGLKTLVGRGENDTIVTEAEPRSLFRHSHPDPRGFSNRGDEFSGLTGLEPRHGERSFA